MVFAFSSCVAFEQLERVHFQKSFTTSREISAQVCIRESPVVETEMVSLDSNPHCIKILDADAGKPHESIDPCALGAVVCGHVKVRGLPSLQG